MIPQKDVNMNVTAFRKNIFAVLDDVLKKNEPLVVTTKKEMSYFLVNSFTKISKKLCIC